LALGWVAALACTLASGLAQVLVEAKELAWAPWWA